MLIVCIAIIFASASPGLRRAGPVAVMGATAIANRAIPVALTLGIVVGLARLAAAITVALQSGNPAAPAAATRTTARNVMAANAKFVAATRIRPAAAEIAVSTAAVKKNSRMNYGAYQEGAAATQW